jgi:hypothetical protein
MGKKGRKKEANPKLLPGSRFLSQICLKIEKKKNGNVQNSPWNQKKLFEKLIRYRRAPL